MQQLKTSFDKNKAAVDLDSQEVHNNDVASLVKLYIRELPRPLCTYSHYEDFIKVSKIDDQTERLGQLGAVIQTLPEVNRVTLGFLMHHLAKVAENESTNKMGVPNLAIVFGPGLIRSENEMNALKDFRHQSKVVDDMIRFHDSLFPGQ